MSEEIRTYLDGEAEEADLSDGARREAAAWDRLLDAFRQDVPAPVAPPWLEERIMAEIRALPTRGRVRSALAWLWRPRPVRVPPLVAGLAAAAVAWLALVPRGPASPGGFVPEEAVVYVQFVLESPDARSVAVGGDFDGWHGSHALQDVDGDGVWSGRVPVRPGVHGYMFLIDGSTWVTDPRAERYADDGFGNRNAVLAVAGPST